MIGIIDLGVSNISSVKNSLEFLKIPNILIKNLNDFKKVKKIVLPGVGTFGSGMKNLKKKGFDKMIYLSVKNEKKPILGICLGMQLLLESSDESPGIKGLSLIKGVCKKFSKKVKVPHIGWNNIKMIKDCLLLKGLKNKNFYFINSYYCDLANNSMISSVVRYEGYTCSSLSNKNIYGVQFHPEKSQQEGLNILKNFSYL